MSNREPGPGGDGNGLLIGGVAVFVIVAAGGMWLPVRLASPPGYTGQGLFDTAAQVIKGRITWTTACTWLAVGEAGALVLLAGLGMWLLGRRTSARGRVDKQVRHMARQSELGHLSTKGVTESARRLRPSLADAKTITAEAAGVLIGHAVAGAMALMQSWEDMAIAIWGPRTGKTTALAIPAIVAAPGPVLVTSVKGDIVDATHGPR
jgi:hypothetical protein